jgi:hypothetical protein
MVIIFISGHPPNGMQNPKGSLQQEPSENREMSRISDFPRRRPELFLRSKNTIPVAAPFFVPTKNAAMAQLSF